MLIAINQLIKPEAWADANYRGHLLLEGAIEDHALGKEPHKASLMPGTKPRAGYLELPRICPRKTLVADR
jgi:hypothetical protein